MSLEERPPEGTAQYRPARTSRTVVGGVVAVASVALVVGVLIVSAPRGAQNASPEGVAPSATSTPSSIAEIPNLTSPPPERSVSPETPTAHPAVCQPWPTPWAEPSFEVSSRTQREINRLFWDDVTSFARFSKTFKSLDDITQRSHLIVAGHLVGFSNGYFQPFGADLPPELASPIPDIFGLVHVDEVIKGEPVSRVPGTVEVAGLGSPEMAPTEIPDSEFIIFLVNHAQQRIDEGVPASCDPDDRYHYERPNGYQTVLLENGDVIQIIQGPKGWEEEVGPFPSDLDGEPVQSVEKKIAAVTAAP